MFESAEHLPVFPRHAKQCQVEVQYWSDAVKEKCLKNEVCLNNVCF